MKCNVNCSLMKEGKSTATLWVMGKAYMHCVYRHQEPLSRKVYERIVMVGGDITSTWCYRGKIVRARGTKKDACNAIVL